MLRFFDLTIETPQERRTRSIMLTPRDYDQGNTRAMLADEVCDQLEAMDGQVPGMCIAEVRRRILATRAIDLEHPLTLQDYGVTIGLHSGAQSDLHFVVAKNGQAVPHELVEGVDRSAAAAGLEDMRPRLKQLMEGAAPTAEDSVSVSISPGTTVQVAAKSLHGVDDPVGYAIGREDHPSRRHQASGYKSY